MVEVIRQAPHAVLRREELARRAVDRGLNPSTISVLLTYSPVIERIELDLWTLRGVRVEPMTLAALRRPVGPRNRRIEDFGWTPAGRPWMVARLPFTPEAALVIGVPSGIERYVSERSFRVRLLDGTEAGTLTVGTSGSSWGYGPFMRRSGADEGDRLRVTFDLGKAEALLELVDDENEIEGSEEPLDAEMAD